MRQFINKHYRHFNAAALRNAAQGYVDHLDNGGKMLITLAGAMSTAELGIQLAEMIRQDKVAAICCTGANLEEDLFNAVAHNDYRKIPNYRDLRPEDEWELVEQGYNRVTDTCIPEETAMRRLETFLRKYWQEAKDKGERYLPHEYMFKVVKDPEFQKQFQIPREHSWMLAAAEKNLPVIVPGWEDSTCANFFASWTIRDVYPASIMKSGIEYMQMLVSWYLATAPKTPIGFFQIGGGIAGDFPICAVPLIRQDLEMEDAPLWGYFCQITDAQESYGGYSGALPNEKITWGKLAVDTPKYVIHSDATIVAPLVFAYVLDSKV